jgi:tetratricopeptide (TPR) repeat protein
MSYQLAENEANRENYWKKNRAKIIGAVLAVLLIAVLGIVCFKYSKELKSASLSALSFTNRAWDKVFGLNTKTSIGEAATSTNKEGGVSSISFGTSSENASSVEAVATSTVATSTQEATSTEEIATSSLSFNSAIVQARTFWAAGEYESALSAAKTALEKALSDGEKAKANYWMGLSYYSLGDKTEAEKAELLAIGFNTDFEPPYVTISAIKLDQKDCQAAFEYSEKAFMMNPNDPWARNNLGLSYLCLGDRQNAIIQLQKAASLAPNSDIIRSNLQAVLQ